MPFTYHNNSFNYSPQYLPQQSNMFVQPSATNLTTDNIRPNSLYVECDETIENGHLLFWSGSASMFSKDGTKILNFSGENGYEFALGKVEKLHENNSKRIAGIVLEKAAEPNSTNFLHKGVHSLHAVTDSENIFRIATKGSVVLAWVLDSHENQLEGLYEKQVNGVFKNRVVIRELGEQYFTIEDVQDQELILQELETLKSRFDELTT